jgi:uncharacterized protein
MPQDAIAQETTEQEAALHEEMRDDGLKSLSKAPLRTCIVTRETLPQARLLRFVLSPENNVTPDILHKLPGRGAWVKLHKQTLEHVIKKRLFARAFKQEVHVQEGLYDTIIGQMKKGVLEALSLTNRSGLAIAGAFKVQKTIEQEEITAYLHASNGEEDGYRKILALLKRAHPQEMHENDQDANERLHFENKSVWKKKLISRAFTSQELGKAVGKEDAVHLVIKSGVGARLLKARLMQLQEITDNE